MSLPWKCMQVIHFFHFVEQAAFHPSIGIHQEKLFWPFRRASGSSMRRHSLPSLMNSEISSLNFFWKIPSKLPIPSCSNCLFWGSIQCICIPTSRKRMTATEALGHSFINLANHRGLGDRIHLEKLRGYCFRRKWEVTHLVTPYSISFRRRSHSLNILVMHFSVAAI